MSRIPISEWPVTQNLEPSAPTRASSSSSIREEQQILRQHKLTMPQAHAKYNSVSIQPLTSFCTEPLCKKSKLDENCLLLETESQEALCSKDRNMLGSSTEEALISNSSAKESNQILKEYEPLAEVRVARWWRRHKHLHTESSLPRSNNPNTMLFHISRTKDCISYLLEEKRKLRKKLSQLLLKDRADVHAAIASIDDWLGNYKAALARISDAVELEPTKSKYRWLKAKLQKQCRVIDIQKVKMELINTVPRAFPATLEVDRISATDLGTKEFIERFVQRRKPVILLDVVKDMTAYAWDLDFVRSVAGSIKATVKHAVLLSVEWAKLEPSHEITVGEFIDQVKEGQTSDYLFDWSLPIHCPELARDLTIPKYFSDNFLQKTSPGSLYHDSWPSLFIAPKGTVSNLHIDAFASNFWMALFQGEKRWTFFDSDDTPLLYPQYVHSMDPVFHVDLSHPDVEQWPLLALTKPRQCTLQPGELLFVPAGSPHYVENLSNSLAVSANHVDQSNYKLVCEELRISTLLDPRAADLLQQLENPNFVQIVQESSQDLGKMKTAC